MAIPEAVVHVSCSTSVPDDTSSQMHELHHLRIFPRSFLHRSDVFHCTPYLGLHLQFTGSGDGGTGGITCFTGHIPLCSASLPGSLEESHLLLFSSAQLLRRCLNRWGIPYNILQEGKSIMHGIIESCMFCSISG